MVGLHACTRALHLFLVAVSFLRVCQAVSHLLRMPASMLFTSPQPQHVPCRVQSDGGGQGQVGAELRLGLWRQGRGCIERGPRHFLIRAHGWRCTASAHSASTAGAGLRLWLGVRGGCTDYPSTSMRAACWLQARPAQGEGGAAAAAASQQRRHRCCLLVGTCLAPADMEASSFAWAKCSDTPGACDRGSLSFSGRQRLRLGRLTSSMPAAFNKSRSLVQVFQGVSWNTSWPGEPAMQSA